MNASQKHAKVILAGAGPGDPELITLKLQKRLQEADVIITDRLVNPSIISSHAKKDAVVLFAGKQGYNDESIAQETINQLIVENALAGKTVLRLKGGDVAFFSNVLDELIALQQQDISFEIVPGITAASGASAYSGIPLTARGFAQGVQFIAFNPNHSLTEDHWKSIAASPDTLVFYMAAKNIIELANSLIRFGMQPIKPIAVIEQATTIHQHIHISTVEKCAREFFDKTFSSPSLIIIGEVVELHEKFKWFNSEPAGTVFQPLNSVAPSQ